jgi:uncharacterized protein YjiS (DUF1127 family)
MLARLLGQAAHWVARTTGLAVLGRSLSRNLFMPLRRATLRRRTVIGLQQLDNRLLSDIGLKREEIGYLATQLSQASVPSPVAERRVPGALKSRIRRWRTRRELEALGDDVLSDIGVRRSEIPTLVKQLQGQNDGPAAGAAIESAPSAGARFSAVMRDILGVLDSQIRRRRARRELEALSDHVLNDIGVRRSEIPALAKKLHGPVTDSSTARSLTLQTMRQIEPRPFPAPRRFQALATAKPAFSPISAWHPCRRRWPPGSRSTPPKTTRDLPL